MLNDSDLRNALHGQIAETTSPDSPLRRMLWMSRLYLSSLIRGQPTPQWLACMLDGPGDRQLLRTLMRVWDPILATSDERLQLHNPDCPCLSLHEQALVTATKSLQTAGGAGFEAAMLSILPRSAVRLMRPAIQNLADTLSQLELARKRKSEPTVTVRERLAMVNGSRKLH